jgi:hypothetical protein
VRHNFRINRGFPNPPRNYLRVLRAEIKNQNSFSAILGGTENLCLQEYYFTDSTKIVKRDRLSCSQNYLITANQFLTPADATLSPPSGLTLYPSPDVTLSLRGCPASRNGGPLTFNPDLAQTVRGTNHFQHQTPGGRSRGQKAISYRNNSPPS